MGTRLKLRGDYDVWRRDELRAQLAAVDLSDDVRIDLSEATLIDAGAAALFILLERRLHERTPDARVFLINTPPIVERMLQLCGATHLFVFTQER
jgi:anti-anti-sigma regulatory factor